MNEVTPATKQLISKYAIWQKSLIPKEGASTIHVDEVASTVAAFYEKIRTIIDWKEEHLMRRTAIIRKLKRRFLDLELNSLSAENMAEDLVLELIRGGYFSNDKIEESKIKDAQRIINKYVFILNNNPANKKGKTGVQFYANLLEIAACEIEETLAPSIKEITLIEYMFSEMRQRIKVHEDIFKRGLLKPEDVDMQIYIAVQKALFKFDEPIIRYKLLQYKYSYWDNPSQEELIKVSQNIQQILKTIDAALSHPLEKKFYAICEKYDTPYLLLGDIIVKQTPEKISEEIYYPTSLEGFIRETYTKRLKDLKEKIKRAALYSTISIFVTKILALVLIEWALSLIIHQPFNGIFLILDILIPTALMAALIATVQPPSKKNLNLVILETMKVVYQKDKLDVYDIKPARRRSVMTRAILSFIYLAGACLSFGLIYVGFAELKFPLISIIINILFIALILFTGTALRIRSRELSIEDEHQGIGGFISDILFLPIASVGRWLSNTWKQYNAITAFFNALIDMPFSTFVEFLERWRYFIKERKEDIR